MHLFEWTPGGSGWATDTLIANNIFYLKGIGRNHYGLGKKSPDDGVWITKPGFGGAKGVVFQNNVVFGPTADVPEEWKTITSDPMLVTPGTAKDGFDSVEGYQLQEGSPCIGTGTPIPDNGGRDFWGNAVKPNQKPAIGVHEQPRAKWRP